MATTNNNITSISTRHQAPRPIRRTGTSHGTADVLEFGPRDKPIVVMIERFRERTVWEGEAARDVGRVWPVIAGVDLSGLRARDGQGEGEIRVEVYQNGTAKVRAIGNVTTGLVGQAVMTVNLIRAALEMGLWN